jgi:hypothetical protein
MKTAIREFKETDCFLSIMIYKFPLGNCGGITDTVKDIFIPCADGNYKYSQIENKELIFIEEQRGAEYWALKPLIQPTGMNGPMSGGNIAYSSDSRCKHVYHIHDRFEAY